MKPTFTSVETAEVYLTVPQTHAPGNDDESLNGRERLFSILNRANEIADTADLNGLVNQMLDLMMEVTQAESVNFFQADEGTEDLVVTAVRGDQESQHLIGLRLNAAEGLLGISISGKQPVVIGDLPSDPLWLQSVDPNSAARKRNVISLPISQKENLLGVVQLFNFKQAELDLLLVLGDRLAVELEHQRQLESSEQSNQRLRKLIDALGQMAGTLDRNQLLHLVAEHVSVLVDSERSSVFLVDPLTKEMVFQVAYRSPEAWQAHSHEGMPDKTSNARHRGLSARGSSWRTGRLTDLNQSEFRYFGRAAITVPIKSEPLSKDHAVDRRQTLGGLMAFNKQQASFQEEDALLMQILANQASTFLQVSGMYESAGELFLDAIKALVAAIDAKDPYTQGHSQRVSDYSVLIAQELDLSGSEINDIRIGSLLHDIGKIGIPDAILLKAGKLTNEEYEVIKRHPATGVNILGQVRLLESVMPSIAEHHERLDGSGYPYKLAGWEISQMGRIVAVADVFDAMTSHRPYRKALSVPEVLSYLKEQSGTLFDNACVQALVNIFTRTEETAS